MNIEATRIEQLEREAEHLEAMVAKLQIDAAQVTGKDKLIAEMQEALDAAEELIRALEAGQKRLVDALNEVSEL